MLGEKNVLQSQFQFSNMEQIEKEQIKKSKSKKQNSKSTNSHPKGFYYNIQVIRKVATFLENVKLGAVRQHIQLKPQDLAYISNEQELEESDENLFRYDNKYIVFIEIIVLLASLFCLWKNSYELIFGKFEEIALTSIPALLIQILYKFIYINTELKNEKLEIISTRRQIFMNYLRNFVIFDVIYFLGSVLQYFDNLFIFYPSKVMGFCIIVTFISISDKLQNIFAKTTTLQTLMSIIKLLVKIMVFIHFLSLIFNCMTIIQRQNGTEITWVQYNFQEKLSNFQKYVNGWYWGSTILSTVGFGDITPANTWERGFISFVEVFCCAMFGYCVNYIGTMIGLFGQSKATYEKDIRRLNYYLKSVQIPQKLKNQIRSHFYNKYQIQQVYNPEAQQYLFSKFTDKITSEVKQNNNLNIISQSQPLHIFSSELIHKLAGSLNKAVYAPSELVFDENSNKSKLFIVEEGQISEIPSNQKFLKKIKPLFTFTNEDATSKNTFGWFNFLTGQKYTTCAKANKFSIVYQLLRDDFLTIVRQFKNDFYKFLQTKEKLTINPVISVKQCLICGRLTHNVSNCPRIHFIPRKIYSLLLHDRKKFMTNSRRNYKRAAKLRCKALYPIQQINSSDQIIQNEEIQSGFVSKKRVSVDKLNTSMKFNLGNLGKERRNTLLAKRNSSLLQMTPHMKQIIEAAQNFSSSESINLGGTSTGNNFQKTFDEFPESIVQTLPKAKKTHKIDRVLLDETQYYFPAFHVSKILESVLGRSKVHPRKSSFIIEKQLSSKSKDKFALTNRKMLVEDQTF